MCEFEFLNRLLKRGPRLMTVVDLLGDYRGSDSVRGTGELARTPEVVTGLSRGATSGKQLCDS